MRSLLRRWVAFCGALAAFALPGLTLRAAVAQAAPSRVVTLGAELALPAVPDAARAWAGVAFNRVVQSGRNLAPGLAERLEGMLEQRRLGADGEERSPARRTGEAVLQVSGVAIIGLVLALLVLVTALGPLEGVIKTVEADVSGAFWRGLVAQAITLPLIALVLLALALTVVGLLMVPIVLMASTLAIAGVSTLGILAVAAVIGRARARGDAPRSRARLLRALLIGYALLWTPWMLAALLVAVPGAGLTVRIVALASTWVVATVGVGAVLRSRGGSRVPDEPVRRAAVGAPAKQPDWSTPTPVQGVVAARRETPVSQVRAE